MGAKKLSFLRGVLLSGGLMAVLLLYLIQHIQVMNINFKIQELEKAISVMQRENERIEVVLARDTSLENIDRIAVNKLGMIRPVKVEYVLVSEPK